MKKSTLSTLLVSSLIAPTAMIGLTATGAGAASLITIGSFSDPTSPDPLASSGAPVVSNQTGLAGAFGGGRISTVDKGTGALANATLQFFPVGGLAFTQASTTIGSSFSIEYTNLGTTPGSTPLDLLGFDSVQFEISDIGAAPVDFSLNINNETITKTANSTGVFSFDLDSFSPVTQNSFSDVTKFVLGASSTLPGFRVEITGAIVAVDVPEPSALGGLLVFGLLGFATAKKRANKSEEN